MKNVLYKCIGALLAALAFNSCNDGIDIRQDYDFSLVMVSAKSRLQRVKRWRYAFILTVKGTMKRRSMK